MQLKPRIPEQLKRPLKIPANDHLRQSDNIKKSLRKLRDFLLPCCVLQPSYADVYCPTVNLYPSPLTVIRYLGVDGSSSIFCLSLLTYTMIAFSSMMVSPQITE